MIRVIITMACNLISDHCCTGTASSCRVFFKQSEISGGQTHDHGFGLDRGHCTVGLRLQQGHTQYLLKTEPDLFMFGPSFSELENRRKNRKKERKEGEKNSQSEIKTSKEEKAQGSAGGCCCLANAVIPWELQAHSQCCL